MRNLIVATAVALFIFSGCSGSETKGITDELNESWSEMSSEEQATFCFGYFANSDEKFYAGAAERFGSENADEAVAWAKEICEGE